MPDSTPTWDFTGTSAFPAASSKPPHMPMRALSKRRGVHWVQYSPPSASAHAHAHPDTSSAYLQLHSDTPFPRKCASDDALRGRTQDGSSTPDAFAQTQRAVRRKKSSFDLRDLFLTGGVPPGHRAPSASES
ncbi:uncharacterized protein TRAVEDRAFT_64777 [Trametes versicolor FP-101664 SS1]|uniref:uncharacterized protein n=1 Tax=Trametes versicolor (strain FP-101664) TaxID=717944 RepID=UPI0004623622|nr:uncharacterized protein TRAVEDRAFT_64777 [Trametes versicolor FP-101664 SS1]EIW58232.1 hypothetical protein TRAVEDRAFT_64777 [Trametes versicolor FP-101664 SS1]